MRLDHLAVAARTLDEGAAFVAAMLGQLPGPGGRHPLMGTHNLLLGMGDIYLEVIATDPGAPSPGRPRWFDLDRFAGPPRLVAWVVACDDLDAALAAAPVPAGQPLALERGDLRWRMAVPADGRLPFDQTFPALIQWQGAAHPVQRLPDSGLRLAELVLTHPQAGALRAALPAWPFDPRITLRAADTATIAARIRTPVGLRTL